MNYFKSIGIQSLILLFIGCTNQNGNLKNKTSTPKKAVQQKKIECQINPKSKLFLNFWADMTKDEYECVLQKTIDKSLLVESNNTVLYSLKSYKLTVEPSFEKGHLYKVILKFPIILPADDGTHPNSTSTFEYERVLKDVKHLKKDLIKKYGKPYKENYEAFNDNPYDYGTFWKSDNKTIIFDAFNGILMYVDKTYMDRVDKSLMLNQKKYEQKKLDEINNL